MVRRELLEKIPNRDAGLTLGFLGFCRLHGYNLRQRLPYVKGIIPNIIDVVAVVCNNVNALFFWITR
jgi:hypothetical protein